MVMVVVVVVIAEITTNKGKFKFHCGPIDTVSSITERKRSKLASGQLQVKGGRQLLGEVDGGGTGVGVGGQKNTAFDIHTQSSGQ